MLRIHTTPISIESSDAPTSRIPAGSVHSTAMNFGVNKGENPLVTQNALFIDDLTVLGWEYVDPTSVRRPVAGRAGTRVGLSGRGGRIGYRLPGQQGKGLTVDAAGRIHISID